jgi:phosphoadenosine phosphosulfate reductase
VANDFQGDDLHLGTAGRAVTGSAGGAQRAAGGERRQLTVVDCMMTPSTARPDPELAAELAEAAERLEHAGPLQILAYAVERFGAGLVLAASFQDSVLIDLAMRVAPDVAVVFVDTGFHFPETLDYLHEVERRYHLNLEVLSGGLSDSEWRCGTERCCELRKVAPLNRYLATRTAWMTGLKRVDTPARRGAPVVGWDKSKGLVKVNPIATWTEDDVESYVVERRLARHPLNAFGYHSIGCAPTTSPVDDGDDPRAGRWAGTGKTECGLHL